jgi:hypothetical protein
MNALKTFVPQHLSQWEMPSSYFGATHEGSYVFLGQNRDSDTLTRSNFIVGLERLGGESETVEVIREGHWAVGWVEWIKIDSSDERALKLADEMMSDLDGYPVLDESHYSDLEHQENSEYLASEMNYFFEQLCNALSLDSDELTESDKETLELFIDAAFFYEASYSGEAYFTVEDAKENYERIIEDSDYHRTFKGHSKKIIKLLDEKLGA